MKTWRAAGRIRVMLRGLDDSAGRRILAPISQRNCSSGLSVGSHWNDEQILREEIFSIERLEQHARSLAAAQPITRQPGLPPFARRAPAQQRKGAARRVPLHRQARSTKAAASRPPPNGCSTTTTWSKSRSARSARTCRPASTASCPSSPTGRSPGFRACSASPGPSSRTPTAASSRRPCGASCAPTRSVEPLTIGELWAVAITLRIVLVENLRRVAQRIVIEPRGAPGSRRGRRPPARRQRPDAPIRTRCARGSESLAALTPAFAVQLVQRLRDQDPKVTPALLWLEERARARRAPAPSGWSRKSTSARAPRTSRCATSSPACG